MLVIRPSVNKNRPLQSNLQATKSPIILQTTISPANKRNITNAVVDLHTAASSSTGNH